MSNANTIPLPSIDGFDFEAVRHSDAIDVRCVRTGWAIRLSVDGGGDDGKPFNDGATYDANYSIEIGVRAANRGPIDPMRYWGNSGHQLYDYLPWIGGVVLHGNMQGELQDDPEVNGFAGLVFESDRATVYDGDQNSLFVPMWCVSQGPIAAAIDWLCEAHCDRRLDELRGE